MPAADQGATRAMAYFFDSLSAFDFECLVRDLMEAELGVRLEVFSSGPDAGVDVRSTPGASGRTVVIQCKHYHSSQFPQLLRAARVSAQRFVDSFEGDLEDVDYFLVTSRRLTQKQKQQLYAAAAIGSRPPQVRGLEDLEALLRTHRPVERAHAKLWLPTGNALESLLRAKTRNRADFLLKRVPSIRQIYIQSRAHYGVRSALDTHHVAVVTGPPGIGKTSLAAMVAAEFASDGFEVVIASKDIEEAEDSLVPGRRQIVLYDDFLGKVAGQVLLKNEDSRLSSLIDDVQERDEWRLLLTSREYILRDALLRYDELGSIEMDRLRVVVNVDTYTEGQRARLFYNHAKEARLPIDDEISLFNVLQRIVNHPNFTPRLIEQPLRLWDQSRSSFPGTTLGKVVVAAHDDPRFLWERIYAGQLTADDRVVLLALFTFGEEVNMEALLGVARHLAPAWSDLEASLLLRQAIRRMDGTFVQVESFRGVDVVGFANPSVLDFLIGQVTKTPDTIHALVRASTSYSQALNLLTFVLQRDDGIVEHGRLAGYLDPHVPSLLEVLRSKAEAGRALVARHPSTGFRPMSVELPASDNLATTLEIHAEFGVFPKEWWSDVVDRVVADLGGREALIHAVDLVDAVRTLDPPVVRASRRLVSKARSAVRSLPPTVRNVDIVLSFAEATVDPKDMETARVFAQLVFDSEEFASAVDSADEAALESLGSTVASAAGYLEADVAGPAATALSAFHRWGDREHQRLDSRRRELDELLDASDETPTIDWARERAECRGVFYAWRREILDV